MLASCMHYVIAPGFQYDAGKFGIFFLTLLLTSMSGAALAFTCSAMVSVFAVANLLVSLVFILYMVSNLLMWLGAL